MRLQLRHFLLKINIKTKLNIKQKLGIKFRRLTLIKYPWLYRPTSDPYISGDTLRKFSDHILDETGTLNPKKVNNNDIVFVRTDLIDLFFSYYHKQIDSKYILISHNSDESITTEQTKYLDSKIIHWFAMKLDFPMNEKISPLPSGLENKRYLANGKIKNFNEALLISEKSDIKKNKILCSFSVHTNYKVRNPLLLQSKKDNKVDVKNFDSSYEYLKELSTYKYNLCPEGNNYESHRIWESLLFGCTPIVLSNKVNNNFFDLGVPILIIDKWTDLNDYDITDLDKLNEVNINKDYKKFVEAKYWKNLINLKKI